MNGKTNAFLFHSGGGIRMVVIGAVLAGLLFAGLMAVRLELFKTHRTVLPASQPPAQARESWMTIWQSDQKIGYSHRQLAVTETGYRLAERTVMRLNTMGVVQDIQVDTEADLHADMSVSAFTATLGSDRFSFSVQGKVSDGTLQVSTENRQSAIPLEGPLYITAGIWEAVSAMPLQPGNSVEFPLFDPFSLGSHSVQVTFVGQETVRILGARQDARKFSIAFMGISQNAWLDDTGEVLKEEGLLGLTLQKDTRDTALDTPSLAGSRDLTLATSIPAGRMLAAPETLVHLKMKMGGALPGLMLDGGRQSFSEDILTIDRESLPDPSELSVEEAAEFLAATPFMASDHPEIIAAAKEAVGTARRPLAKARNLVRWVYEAIEKRPVLSVPTALNTLRQRAGDCNEHAVLLAALARAAGIPARVEAGLVYMNGRFYYHAWNSLYLGEWVTADALMNQLPTDVTHIRMVRGSLHEQADILGAIGRITVQIIGESQ